ncbi:calcium-activated potassium channel subunit beta-3-like [Astyanax mexicanus]|uniref:Calcium-activated potassium channel subunit beta-3-like n=1 Tax=Astyanax mexicanus TaxID=7994 RepID=A0A8T2LY45_ASTMX|nr:calcium-activated potassium channel subunit beta-3-like [Astyanax mexicanus]
MARPGKVCICVYLCGFPHHTNIKKFFVFLRELMQSSDSPQSKRDRAGEKTKTQTPVSTVGEERAFALGFTMIAFSILMYFVVGISVVKPSFQSDWGEATNCSLVQVKLPMDLNSFPCLQVFVNITAQEKRARLHYDEVAVNMNPECFYTPKSQLIKIEQVKEVQNIKDFLTNILGQVVTCHPRLGEHPEDVIMKKRYDRHLGQQYLLWPSLMLIGGCLLVGLVKLTQFLARLCTEINKRKGNQL